MTPLELRELIIKTKSQTSVEKILELNRILDTFFIKDLEKVEATILSSKDEAYAGIQPDALLTPYLDYYHILADLEDEEVLLDVGAGHARGVFLSQFLGLKNCLGVENIQQRVSFVKKALKRLNLCSEAICLGDMTVNLKMADAYYLYLPKNKALDLVLSHILMRSTHRTQKIYACESHGDLIDYLNQLSCLKLMGKIKCSLPRHNNWIHKYEVVYQASSEKGINDLAHWYLLNINKKYLCSFRYLHSKSGLSYEWLVSLEYLELVFYHGHLSFKTKSGRIIAMEREEKFLNFFCDSQLEKISHSIKPSEKLLRKENKLFIELSNGHIQEVFS
ncbi:MAG: hypothetical protein QF441_09100 [Bacteriovoracaceae bacterium]|jgi:hypothetical protein|nr:hypothetical protein [Halobacteriovoraceae bacterium]MDP7320751.1 hypothetical protein [Bacteriovoracaceae bacterium]